MLLSDLAGKEIINLNDGARLGLVGDADLEIASTGRLKRSFLAPVAVDFRVLGFKE